MNAFKCDKGRQLQIEECVSKSMVEPKDKRAELNTETTFKAEENGVGETSHCFRFKEYCISNRPSNI